MFENFPKHRIALPPHYRKIFQKHYLENRKGKSPTSWFSQRLESWMHRKVASDLTHNIEELPTLEIGAGTLNHLPYETNVKPYDIIEPSSYLLEDSLFLDRVRMAYHDIEQIPSGNTYKRIISIATFEHISNLPEVVSRSCLLLSSTGQLRVGIPSEGTTLWRVAQKLTTGLEFRLRYNLNYGVLMKYDHINTAEEIEQILRYFFEQVNGDYFGLHKRISFYQFFACSTPHLERSKRYLEDIGRKNS